MQEQQMSNHEIEELCEEMIKDFIRKAHLADSYVDIRRFITDYLKLNIEFTTIAEPQPDKIAFFSNGADLLWVFENGTRFQKVYPKNTIVIDQYLLQSGQEDECRFNMAHEAGHYLNERMHPTGKASFNRPFNAEIEYTVEDLRQMWSINESYANKFGSALLAPRFVIDNAMKDIFGRHKLRIYGDGVIHPEDRAPLYAVKNRLCVSNFTLLIRLRKFGFVESHSINELVYALAEGGKSK